VVLTVKKKFLEKCFKAHRTWTDDDDDDTGSRDVTGEET
jgi:hypothetical protein